MVICQFKIRPTVFQDRRPGVSANARDAPSRTSMGKMARDHEEMDKVNIYSPQSKQSNVHHRFDIATIALKARGHVSAHSL